MTGIMALAEGVAGEIGGDAVVSLAPDYTLRDVKDSRRVVVVPVGIEHRMLSRSHREDAFRIQVGVLRKSTEDELEELVGHVQGLALSFLRRRIGNATCTEARHSPLFVPEHLKERRQFTGIVELTFREVEGT